MDKNTNIYNYKAPKHMNEEVHFLLTKGRITIKAFLLRLFLSIILIGIPLFIYQNYALPKKLEKVKIINGVEVIYDTTFKTSFYIFENFTFYVMPIIVITFMGIQIVKRIHDTNNSGWYALIPIYNIFLFFQKGTEGNNDYGIDPNPKKDIDFFDELENKNE